MMEGALAAVFAFLAALWFAKRSKRNAHLLQQYERCMNSFTEDAETIVKADETPEAVIDMVEFIARKTASRSSAREFLFVLLRHRSELASGPTGSTSQAMTEFTAKNPELGHVLSRAMAAGLMAIMYNGGPIGTFVRRLVLFDAKQHEDRTRDLAASFRQIGKVQAA
jgi:hypothetical protein